VIVIVNDVRLIDEQVARASRSVSIALPAYKIDDKFFDDMFAMLSECPGRTDVFLEVVAEGLSTRLAAPALGVQGSVALEKRLVEHGCSVKWSL
jgi:hypothetical protein